MFLKASIVTVTLCDAAQWKLDLDCPHLFQKFTPDNQRDLRYHYGTLNRSRRMTCKYALSLIIPQLYQLGLRECQCTPTGKDNPSDGCGHRISSDPKDFVIYGDSWTLPEDLDPRSDVTYVITSKKRFRYVKLRAMNKLMRTMFLSEEDRQITPWPRYQKRTIKFGASGEYPKAHSQVWDLKTPKRFSSKKILEYLRLPEAEYEFVAPVVRGTPLTFCKHNWEMRRRENYAVVRKRDGKRMRFRKAS